MNRTWISRVRECIFGELCGAQGLKIHAGEYVHEIKMMVLGAEGHTHNSARKSQLEIESYLAFGILCAP